MYKGHSMTFRTNYEEAEGALIFCRANSVSDCGRRIRQSIRLSTSVSSAMCFTDRFSYKSLLSFVLKLWVHLEPFCGVFTDCINLSLERVEQGCYLKCINCRQTDPTIFGINLIVSCSQGNCLYL